MALELTPQPLTPDVFQPFGDVIEASGNDFLTINFGNTERYHDLIDIDTSEQGGKTGISIFRSSPITSPTTIKLMERHPLSSQAFISLERRPFLALVAPPSEQPKLDDIKLFLVGANQGVNYHRGVWHHYLFSLDTHCDFICIDRCGGEGNNCDEHYFEEDILIRW